MLALRSQVRKYSVQAVITSNTAPQEANAQAANTTSSQDPLQHEDYFGVNKLVTIKDMVDAKVHLGHMEGSLHPAMRQYVYGSRLGHCIFDLDLTASLLRRSLHVLANIVYRDGIILFFAPPNRGMAARITELCAQRCKEFSHVRPWKQGTFTNSENSFGLVTRLPDLCIFIATPHEAITESAKMSIPTLGIVDSNADPRLITYHIPGNDDSISAVNYYCKLFADTIKIAKAKRQEDGV